MSAAGQRAIDRPGRLVWVVLAMLLLASAPVAPGVLARQAAPGEAGLAGYLPGAAELGEGWFEIERGSGLSSSVVARESAWATFAGPAGAHIFMNVFDLPRTLSERADAWDAVTRYWQGWYDSIASYRTAPHQRAPVITPLTAELPPGIEDMVLGEGASSWLQIAAVAAYAVDNGPAIVILIEGEWNSLVALDACDRLLALMLDRASRAGAATPVG